MIDCSRDDVVSPDANLLCSPRVEDDLNIGASSSVEDFILDTDTLPNVQTVSPSVSNVKSKYKTKVTNM
jgi:hypothetical protein